MDYAEFQAYFTRKHWRTGDAEWMTDLPQLIQKAEARINRDLRYQAVMATTSIAITADTFELPGDLREIASLKLATSNSPAVAVSLPRYRELEERLSAGQTSLIGTAFATLGKDCLLLANASVDNPNTVNLDYYMGITPYKTDPLVPFYDLHPDFYEAALNVQAYEYLKNFDLSGEYNSQYATLLEAMRAESEYLERPSGQIATALPGAVL
jgi:hypothetical protein